MTTKDLSSLPPLGNRCFTSAAPSTYLGFILQELLDNKNLTWNEVYRRTKIEPATMFNIITGKSKPSYTTLCNLKKLLSDEEFLLLFEDKEQYSPERYASLHS